MAKDSHQRSHRSQKSHKSQRAQKSQEAQRQAQGQAQGQAQEQTQGQALGEAQRETQKQAEQKQAEQKQAEQKQGARQPENSPGRLELVVEPLRAPVDHEVSITVRGARAGAEVTLRLSADGHESEAVFLADERGVVDATRHAPVSGSYAGVDPMGLFWSARPTGEQPGTSGKAVLTATATPASSAPADSVSEGAPAGSVPASSAAGGAPVGSGPAGSSAAASTAAVSTSVESGTADQALGGLGAAGADSDTAAADSGTSALSAKPLAASAGVSALARKALSNTSHQVEAGDAPSSDAASSSAGTSASTGAGASTDASADASADASTDASADAFAANGSTAAVPAADASTPGVSGAASAVGAPAAGAPAAGSAHVSGASAVVEVELERLSVPDGVRRVEFAGGVLFEPEGGGSGAAAAGVIVLGGSEGGLRELDAALLAGHGFAVLALPYFGAPGVPENLVDVPLEHVGGAVDALAERVGGPVGLVGGSRGGELALLAASVLPSVRAVVSVVGSGVVTQCVGAGKRLLEILEVDAAAWTWKGQPVPYLPHVVSPGMRAAIVDGEPVVLAEAFDLGDGFPEDVEIPVERIAGPVLLVSGDRDASWPSADLSEVAHRRLEANDHPHPHEHVVHPGAGHLLAGPPNRPQPDNVVDGPGVRFEMGGDRATTARAKADTWNRTTTFLKTHLKTRPKSQLKTQGSPDRTA